MHVKDFLLVGLGGAIGSVLRYTTGILIKSTTDFPLHTWLINLAGSLLIGILASGWLNNHKAEVSLSLFLITGICGGFTTFSAFSWEGINLLQQQKLWLYLAYVSSSILGGLFFVWLGIRLAKFI